MIRTSVIRFLNGLPEYRRQTRRLVSPAGALSLSLSVSLLTGGCASQDYPFVDVAQANARAEQGPRLDAGDKLRIVVFDEPSLTGEYEVATSGAVTLPLISDVPASGSTTGQVADAITGKLAQGGYVLNPRVAVDIVSYRPFYILGEVGKPGEYTYAGELSLLQAVAKAGGFTARANKGTIVVMRKSWGGGRRVNVGDPALLVMPGDTITVSESMM